MATIRKKEKKGVPEMSTAALPDIIFMLLFFFMVAAQPKQETLQVEVALPQAESVKKLEKKSSAVAYISVGQANTAQFRKLYGSKPVIQLNDKISQLNEINSFVGQSKAASKNNDVIMSLKVDRDTRMGIVSDIKQELRKANQLRINYAGEAK